MGACGGWLSWRGVQMERRWQGSGEANTGHSWTTDTGEEGHGAKGSENTFSMTYSRLALWYSKAPLPGFR